MAAYGSADVAGATDGAAQGPWHVREILLRGCPNCRRGLCQGADRADRGRDPGDGGQLHRAVLVPPLRCAGDDERQADRSHRETAREHGRLRRAAEALFAKRGQGAGSIDAIKRFERDVQGENHGHRRT